MECRRDVLQKTDNCKWYLPRRRCKHKKRDCCHRARANQQIARANTEIARRDLRRSVAIAYYRLLLTRQLGDTAQVGQIKRQDDPGMLVGQVGDLGQEPFGHLEGNGLFATLDLQGDSPVVVAPLPNSLSHQTRPPMAYTSLSELAAAKSRQTEHEAALEAGKHVLIEKPIARTYTEAVAIAEAARTRKRKVMVGMNHRFRPDAMVMKSFLDGKELGKVLYTRTGWLRRRGWRQHRGGHPGRQDLPPDRRGAPLHELPRAEPRCEGHLLLGGGGGLGLVSLAGDGLVDESDQRQTSQQVPAIIPTCTSACPLEESDSLVSR